MECVLCVLQAYEHYFNFPSSGSMLKLVKQSSSASVCVYVWWIQA